MEGILKNLFPELLQANQIIDHDITMKDLQKHPYFNDLVPYFRKNTTNQFRSSTQSILSEKQTIESTDLKHILEKVCDKFTVHKVPKGTIIYAFGMFPDEGFLVMHGRIEILARKSNREKLSPPSDHICHSPAQKNKFLKDKYNIEASKAELLYSHFFQEQVLFNFTPFRSIYGSGYFGCRQMMRNSLRTKTVIATQQTLLVKIKKDVFDKYLRNFEDIRERFILRMMMKNTKSEVVEQILPKMFAIFSSTTIVKYQMGETIFKEDDEVDGIYFLLDGECQLSKTVKIQVPKTILINENKNQIIKEVQIKISRIIQNSLVGDLQSLLSIQKHEFTVSAVSNSTILIKFELGSFLKAISESALYERQLCMNAKHKYLSAMQIYSKKRDSIVKQFFTRYHDLENKKKQSLMVGLLQHSSNPKNNDLYEVFNKQGVFYRDHFQKLEGFDEFEKRYDPKRSVIPKHKARSTSQGNFSKNYIKEETDTLNQNILDMQAATKSFLSPKKNVNPVQLVNEAILLKLSPGQSPPQFKNQRSMLSKKSKKLFSKFQQLKKDDTIHKRVLILNGAFEKSKETSKVNSVKPIINHHFDNVIKQCITRKNQILKRAILENKDDIVKEAFRKSVSILKSATHSAQKFSRVASSHTCKGANEFRKKLQHFKCGRKSETVMTQKKNDNDSTYIGLETYLGMNQYPQTSYAKSRSQFDSPMKSPSKLYKQTVVKPPQKLVLLNHMMKPIVYYSMEL